jgi:hypothetical protein
MVVFVNHRPPPEQLARTKMGQVSSWCRYDPLACLGQVGLEALFIACAYAAILRYTGGTVPNAGSVVKFLAAFVALSVCARMISDDLGNKLSISAVSGIGSKTVSMLAPKFVGW